jgi:membrane protein DedA with SNARE-associated domain/rhodanese-related sulfurtransferase
METLLASLSKHGYSILFMIVFLEAIGVPVPAAVALLIAGGAMATGALQPLLTVVIAVGATLTGDILMFLMGRYTGWWLLGILCRLSLNPETCILRTADSFYRRGRVMLLFAKFVPGLNTMAPPLAGSMNMRFFQFVRLDLGGSALYVGAYLAVGFAFSGALEAVTRGYNAFGRIIEWVLAAAIAGYLAYQFWMWRKTRVWRSVPFALPSEVAAAGDALIYDVRSHGYYDRKATRIPGSRRMEPNALHQGDEPIPAGKPVYIYCTCVREATSSRVAHMLREKGVECAVIKGGLRGWKKAGLPVEPVPAEEIEALPVFES